MAIALVQAVKGASSASSDLPATLSASTAGNLIVVQIANFSTRLVTSVTDNVLNAYTQAPNAHFANGAYETDIYYCTNCIAGATTVTAHLSGLASVIMSVEEYSGVLATSGAFDTANGQYQASGSAVGPSLTPSAAGELLVSSSGSTDVFITGVSSPWATLVHETSVNGFASGYYINAPLSAQQAPFTPTTSMRSISSGAVFFQAPTGGASRELPLMGMGA